jgi:hypothetical protein
VENAWAIWRVRAANNAALAANYSGAIDILTRAVRDLPTSDAVRSALASVYMTQHDYDRALGVYKSWGMANAAAGDYRAAAGAAFAVQQPILGERFLLEGRQHWPGDAELLHMTAMNAMERERYSDAAHYLSATLAALREEERPGLPPATPPGNAAAISQQSPALLAVCRTGMSTALTPASVASGVATSPEKPSGTEHHLSPLAMQHVQDELDVVRHRNTPYAAVGLPITARSGSPGIDRLVARDSFASGSATIADFVRLEAAIHAIDLNSGTPDGRSGYRFGSLQLGETFAAQRVNGLGAEVQVSGDGYGAAAGVSPNEFPVRNWTAGFRYGQPASGVMLVAAREHVKDTLLSYAGAVDPASGFVWGGVVSDAASLQASHNVSGSGQYLTLSAGWITGQNVAKNWSVEGTGGASWRLFETGTGSLSLGVSATALHYDKNLNFFSFGNGGYFSPQQYLLASVPIAWRRLGRAVVYEISASAGAQSIKESAAPFYPTRPLEGQSFYPDHVTRGSNYNIATRFAYRFSPHSSIEAFATANNAKNYASQAVGVSLKLLFNGLPTTTDLHPQAIPDWRGRP